MTRLTRTLIWAAQPIVIAIALWLVIGGPWRDARQPLSFSGSGVVTLAQARLILDDGWWSIPELDSTSGRDALLLARNAHVDHALLRVASFMSRRIPAIVTIWWALTLMCGGAACAWGLRRLGVSVVGAWGAGVLFALSPFALSQNISGVGFMPYLVPFAATAAVMLATGRHGEPGWRGLLLGNIALGFNTPYFALFGAFFVAVGAIAGFVRTRDRATARAGALMFGAIVVAAAINLAPNYFAPPAAPQAVETRVSPAEAELHGLKIRQLVTPPPGHWLGIFRMWSDADMTARFPDGGDPPGKRLGAIAAIGFLGLILLLFVPALAGPETEGESARAASRLTLAVLIVAMTGGLSGIVSILVTPLIRDYSFVTAFLMFFALAFIGVAIDRLTAANIKVGIALWAGLVVFGVADHAVALRPLSSNRDAITAEYHDLHEFVTAAERELPRGSLVFQLPVMPPPGGGRVEHMRVFDPFKLYVASRHFQWNVPALSPEAAARQTEAAALDPRDLPSWLQKQGFAAIVVDRFGYHDDGTEVLAALQAVPKAARPVALNPRYVALDIRVPQP